MSTYTETKSTLDEIAERSEQNRKRLQQAKDMIARSISDLLAMASEYSSFSNQVDVDVAANATDEAWKSAGAEKDQMVADFQVMKTRAQGMQAAISGL